jgi:hypothetical protein
MAVHSAPACELFGYTDDVLRCRLAAKEQGWTAMTESEWLACERWDQLLDAGIIKHVESRNLRLFACACCRRIWPLIPDAESRNAVEAAEAFADGMIGTAEMTAARNAMKRSYRGPSDPVMRSARSAAFGTCGSKLMIPAASAANAVFYKAEKVAGSDVALKDSWVEIAAQTALLRDITGNPFRPVTFERSWSTLAVSELAQSIYDCRAFERMPELADALEQAGCTNADVLSHCRGPGTHVRGCWVVDLVLGKTGREPSSTSPEPHPIWYGVQVGFLATLGTVLVMGAILVFADKKRHANSVIAAAVLWSVALLVGVAVGRRATSAKRRRYRRLHGLCERCGYNLVGNMSGHCPECGSPVRLAPDHSSSP